MWNVKLGTLCHGQEWKKDILHHQFLLVTYFFVTFKVPAVETTVTQYTKRGSKHRQLHMRSALRSPHNESKDVLCFHQFLRPLHKLLRSSLSSKRKKSKRLKTAFSLSVSTAVCLCSCWDARFGFSRHSTGFFLSFPAKSQNPFHKSRRRATTSAGERHLVKQYKTTFYYRGTSLLFNEYNPNMLLLMNNLRRRAHPGVTGEQEESYKERVYDFSCSTYN